MPLVLVPGLLCSARLFAPQIAALWPHGPIMVADHRRAQTMDEIADHILADAPPKFALAGLSMGGYIAFAMLRRAPERIAKLALLDTSARADTPEQTAALLTPRFLHPSRHGDETLRHIVRQMAEETGSEAFVRQQRAIMSRPDSRPLLRAVGCPTLVLVGDGDELTPPALAEEIAAGIPGARLEVVPDCGHLSTIEQPDEVNAALGAWLTA